MKGLLLLLIHLVAVLARLLGPGGVRGLVAENVLIKQQLLIEPRFCTDVLVSGKSAGRIL